jgi:adenylosuccinate synthase
MPSTLVIGSQWGDEGKGKIIDVLSETADYVVRFHGGNNAGHTVINSYGTFPMHLIPAGIFAQAKGCITNGVVLDLEVLLSEIEMLKKAGISLSNKLSISPRCHVILPYHKILDTLYEEAKAKNKVGTTGRGIGPVYADKVSYNGIRVADLMNRNVFSEKLHLQLTIKNKIISALGGKPLPEQKITKEYLEYAKQIKAFIREPYPILRQALKKHKSILFEGAHGVFLDNDWGTYPYVTGSTVLSGGINAGAGFPIDKGMNVIGIVKAYTTRVGAGPFPTELMDADGNKLREMGSEFGTTTGRPRRCGWFDAVLIRFAGEINNYTGIALTKLDVLDSFSELKICTGYRLHGKKVEYYELSTEEFSAVQPVYKTMKGWMTSTKGLTDFSELPKPAQMYVKEIERLTNVKIAYISTGAKRHELITL